MGAQRVQGPSVPIGGLTSLVVEQRFGCVGDRHGVRLDELVGDEAFKKLDLLSAVELLRPGRKGKTVSLRPHAQSQNTCAGGITHAQAQM